MELERRNEHKCIDDVTVHVLIFIHFMVTIHIGVKKVFRV